MLAGGGARATPLLALLQWIAPAKISGYDAANLDSRRARVPNPLKKEKSHGCFAGFHVPGIWVGGHLSAGHDSQRIFSSKYRRGRCDSAHGKVPARRQRRHQLQIAVAR